MPTTTMHPNTRAMLQAWRRMTAQPDRIEGGPSVQDYPDLLGRLFILQPGPGTALPFRIAGDSLPGQIGRPLAGTDFMDLWAEADRKLLRAFVDTVLREDRPGLVRAMGDTARGDRTCIEIAFAPLGRSGASRGRLLGLYQQIGTEDLAGSRPVVIHRIRSLFPPESPSRNRGLRLVANND